MITEQQARFLFSKIEAYAEACLMSAHHSVVTAKQREMIAAVKSLQFDAQADTHPGMVKTKPERADLRRCIAAYVDSIVCANLSIVVRDSHIDRPRALLAVEKYRDELESILDALYPTTGA